MQEMKKVSVIIPCYNKEKYVKCAVESALNQTYKNIEIVCIDDASTDNSNNILKELANKYNNIILLEECTNLGVCKARNKAIDIASGEYVLPLDADDIIEPSYIEKAVEILNNNSNISIVYCKAKTIGTRNKVWKLPIYNKDKILFENCIFCSALFRKKDFYKVGKYKNNMNNGCEDWDLWLSFIENNFEVYQIPEILFSYRVNEDLSRTDNCVKYFDDVAKNIFLNHQELYIQNQEFYKRVFGCDIDKIKLLANKKEKYKKLCNMLIIITIIENLLIIVYFMLKNFGGIV